jgi:hemerythrin-like domain-containing protein
MLTLDQLFEKKDDSFSPREAAYSHPLTLLKSCHEKILHFSSALVKLSKVLQQEGWNQKNKDSADQIRRYFNIAAPEHHKDEELHLFPAIIALDPSLQDPEIKAQLNLINQMVQEHVETDTLWEKLDSMLESRSNTFDELTEMGIKFAVELARHAEIENIEIFAFAEQHIDEATLEQMGKAIAKRRRIKLKD